MSDMRDMRDTRPFMQVDVFADRPGWGNPVAVVLDAQGLDEAAMCAVLTHNIREAYGMFDEPGVIGM